MIKKIEDWKIVLENVVPLFQDYDGEITSLDKIHWSMRLLDLVNNFKEEINKPSNLERNIYHVIFASSGKFLVSDDKKFRKKAHFTYRALEIKTKVLSLESFVYLFSEKL